MTKDHWLVKLHNAFDKLKPIGDSIKTAYQNDKRGAIEYLITLSVTMTFCLWIVFNVALPMPVVTKFTHPPSIQEGIDSLKPTLLHVFAIAGALLAIIPATSIYVVYVHYILGLFIKLHNHVRRIKMSKISK